MSQHTGSHKNSLNLFGEKYLNESHWPMRRIRLLECTKPKRQVVNQIWLTLKIPIIWLNKWLKTNDLINL